MTMTDDILAGIKKDPFSRELIQRALQIYKKKEVISYVISGLNELQDGYTSNLSFIADDIVRLDPQEKKRLDTIPSLLSILRNSELDSYLNEINAI